MKHVLVATMFLVLLGVGTTTADYLRVKVDLKHATANPQTAGGQGPGQAGGAAPPGFAKKGGFMGGAAAPEDAPPGTNPGTPAASSTEGNHFWVTVYLDMKSKPEVIGNFAGPWYLIKLNHQFGKNTLIPMIRPSKDIPPPFLETEKITKEPLSQEHARRLAKLKDGGNARALLELAFWAWSHGLMKEFHATFEELKQADAKHAAVAAYAKIQAQLKAPLADDDPATKSYLDEMRAQGYRGTPSDKGHYMLLANLPPVPANDAQIKRRLNRMEDALEAFYFWFALQENVAIPPMPRYRLAGILINDPNDFHKHHTLWGSLPMVGDGFTPRRDNIMILSAKRRDEALVILDNKTQMWMQSIKANPEELLSGDIWDPRKRVQAPSPLSNAVIQTMVVVQKALEDEAERTTISHEAVRQLLAASGLLPRTVAAPEWVQEGLASYFERPFGAVYGAGGLPSWSNLIAFKDLKARGLGQGRDILLQVISDRYFQSARRATELIDEGRAKAAEKAREEWEKARATAWALVYFAVKEQKLDRLLAYASEISQMPRDLDLDQRALESAFAKAFGLGDAATGYQWNAGRLQSFADAWMEDMKNLSLELPDVEAESMKTRRANALPALKKDGPAPKVPSGQPPPPPPPPN